jgi:hypothetical protein
VALTAQVAETWCRPGNFPSRSLTRNRARQPASSKSITRFLAACATQDADGWAVAPRILILRTVCSITANTCSRTPDRVTVSKKSQASRASAWERRKSGAGLGHPAPARAGLLDRAAQPGFAPLRHRVHRAGGQHGRPQRRRPDVVTRVHT